ncbi:MAG: LacI family transcriptional regulator [Phyllobacterium sp.]
MSSEEKNSRSGEGADLVEKPTLRTIAELTGLAVTTVSRALGDAPQIALETRQRVQRVAAEIGYFPDRAAQRLRTGRTNVISLVLDPHDEILGFGTSLIRGLTSALRDTPYHLVVTPHFADLPPIQPVRHIMRNRMADGIVFTRTRPFDERVSLLLENGFPFICHGRTELATPHPYVDFDNFSFAYEATKSLITEGRRKLSIILPPRQFTFFQHMQYGFMSAVREHGVLFETTEAVDLDSPSDAIRDYVFKRSGEADAPDGYICGGEVSALAVMAALTDRGHVPGQDIGLVAKQTSQLFSHIRPRVKTIYEDLAEAGERMGAFLLKRMAGATAEEAQLLQGPRLNLQA